MKSASDYTKDFTGGEKLPKLTQGQWNILAVPAAVLAVMAILQILSFGKFKDWLELAGVGWPVAVAVALIVAELLGAVSMLRVPMTPGVRKTGLVLAVLATGFWFIQNIQMVSNGAAEKINNSGFFGKYLAQAPGWWTVIEITVLLGLVVYSYRAVKNA